MLGTGWLNFRLLNDGGHAGGYLCLALRESLATGQRQGQQGQKIEKEKFRNFLFFYFLDFQVILGNIFPPVPFVASI